MAWATVTQEGNDLLIRIPLQKPQASKSGKTNIVTTTNGFQPTDVVIDGKSVVLSLTAYIKP